PQLLPKHVQSFAVKRLRLGLIPLEIERRGQIVGGSGNGWMPGLEHSSADVEYTSEQRIGEHVLAADEQRRRIIGQAAEGLQIVWTQGQSSQLDLAFGGGRNRRHVILIEQ